MKKNIFLIILTLGLFSFFACEKDGTLVTIKENPVPCSLKTPTGANGLAFTKADAANAIEFTWSAADFGFQAAVNYGVQLATKDNFSDAKTLITTKTLKGSAKVSDINGIFISLKLAVGVSTTVKCRIYSVVSTKVDTAYSAITSFTVTPYDDVVDYPMLYVPGDYQGWKLGDVNGRLFSYGFNNDYENILRLNANGFLIVPSPTSWDLKWGLGSITASGDNYSGTLAAGGGDIKPITAACYVVKFNTTTLAVSFTKTNDWGIIGSAIQPSDWGSDVDMFYNGQRQMWEITRDFVAGEFKFRPNDVWSGDFPSPNLVIPTAGNYTIRMETVNKTYKIIKN